MPVDGSDAQSWDDECGSAQLAAEKEIAAGELIEFLLSLQISGKISARTLCVICWWAQKAGADSRQISKFAQSPTSQSGKFQRRVDSGLDVSTQTSVSYRVKVPVYTKTGVSRQGGDTAVWDSL